jgi:predicted Zn-dependent peptidase
MFIKKTLKNNLRVLLVPQEGTETVTVLVMCKVGSKYETKEISGISHFLEHMLFKGTEKRKNPIDIVESLDEVGGMYNAFTGDEYTGYYAKVDATHFDMALDWISDIYLNSLIPKKEVEKERGVILEEFNMYLDNPMFYIGEVWKKVLYGNQPAGRDVIGTKKTIKTITRNQINDYMNEHYNAENTLICISGKVDGKKVISDIEKKFKKIKKGKKSEKVGVLENQKEPNILVHEKKTGQTQLAIGFRGVNIEHEDRFKLELLASVLGASMSSRMFTEIREKQGLAYSIKTIYDTDTDTGSLITFGGLDSKKIKQGIQSILKEYKKMTEKLVSEKELKRVKGYIKGKTILSLESSESKANFYARQEILKEDILEMEDIFKIIDKISAKDLRDTARKYFTNENLNLAIIGPYKKEEFKNILKI